LAKLTSVDFAGLCKRHQIFALFPSSAWEHNLKALLSC